MGMEKVEKEYGTWRVNHHTETKGTGNRRKPGEPRFRDLDMKTGLVTNREGIR